MNRLIGIFDLAFILLGCVTVGIVVLSPVYRALSIELPKVDGGAAPQEKAVRVSVSANKVGIEGQKFQNLESFQSAITSRQISSREVVLSVDSGVKFERVAKILGILKREGAKKIAFEVEGGTYENH